jgi:hypothetical protein
MARKYVKTAEELHGEGRKEGADAPIARTLERITAIEACGPTMIMEGIATVALSRGVRAYTSAFQRKCWNITEVQDPSFGLIGDQLLRGSKDH